MASSYNLRKLSPSDEWLVNDKGQIIGIQTPNGIEPFIPPGIAQDSSGNVAGILGGDGSLINPARLAGAQNPIVKHSKLQLNYADPALSLAFASGTGTISLSKTYQRYSSYTRQVDLTANSCVIAKSSQTITCDPTDLMLTLSVYLPFQLASGQSISVGLYNSNSFSTTYTLFAFNANYLRQGWNDLRMWSGDTTSSNTSTDGEGTLAFGAIKTDGAGGACNMAANIGYIEITFNNLNGKTVHLDALRRSAKASTKLVMGFDATGTGAADDVMTNAVAPLFSRYGFKGYFTVTNVYDMLFSGSADDERKHALYNTYGWDAVVHTWNHGATVPGGTATVTLSRTSNLVTVTYSAAHGYAVGSKYYASISGATPTDMNGQYELTVTTTTQATYTATGADGAGTGTIRLSTLLADVLAFGGTLSQSVMDQIAKHEIADMAQVMQSVGFWRAANIGAWPNNSCPDITTTQTACALGKVDYFRGIKGSTVKLSEFGIDNPFQFGSVEWGSGTTATTLQYVKDKLSGAIGRGEHMWIYGHYVMDDTNPANAAYAPVDNSYPPGSGGNPNPPGASAQGGIGGWWYLSTIKRFFDEAISPAVANGSVIVQRPSEWAIGIGGAK